MGDSRRVDKSRARLHTRQDMDKSRVRLQTKQEFFEHSWGAPLVSMTIKIWGCEKIYLQADLWI